MKIVEKIHEEWYSTNEPRKIAKNEIRKRITTEWLACTPKSFSINDKLYLMHKIINNSQWNDKIMCLTISTKMQQDDERNAILTNDAMGTFTIPLAFRAGISTTTKLQIVNLIQFKCFFAWIKQEKNMKKNREVSISDLFSLCLSKWNTTMNGIFLYSNGITCSGFFFFFSSGFLLVKPCNPRRNKYMFN